MTVKELIEESGKFDGAETVAICYLGDVFWETRDVTSVTLEDGKVLVVDDSN